MYDVRITQLAGRTDNLGVNSAAYVTDFTQNLGATITPATNIWSY